MSPKNSLSRDKIVERALTIVDTDGLDALTVRRLADEFGVTPMAMYWHFPNKDALLGAVGAAVIETIPVPATDVDLATFLRTAMTSIVDALRAHPETSPLVAVQLLHVERGRDLTEVTLAAMAQAGLDVERAAMVAHNALQTCLMLVTGQPGLETVVAPADREAMLAAKISELRSLDPARYPHLLAAAPSLTECADTDDYYTSGIETFVVGVTRGLVPSV